MIGYTTGTFDLPHDGHFRLLKHANARCDFLIVGLTTDELGSQQKRTPVMRFEHRRSVLEHSKYVGAVVPHEGRSKEEDHARLRFDVLFIGDDYRYSKEYAEFKKCPVVFVPRTPGVSTSDLVAPRVLAQGVAGPIFEQFGCVLKYVRIRPEERGTTADVLGLPIPRPRNWKKPGEVHDKPNIPCVNANRELRVHERLTSFSWNPVLSVDRVGEDYYLIRQRMAGKPLSVWWRDASAKEKTRAQKEVSGIVSDLVAQGVVHGDIHADNVCVSADGEFSLIDFGWCMHSSFDMSTAEQKLYRKRLDSWWDWTHFTDSLQWAKMIPAATPPTKSSRTMNKNEESTYGN